MKQMSRIAAALISSAAIFSAVAADHVSTVPRLDHVFVVMMENHSYNEILNNPNAPFINQYAKNANLATQYFAIGHPSLTNYLEVVGGSNFGVTNDNYPNWHNGPANPLLISPIGRTGVDAATPASTGPFGKALPATQYSGTNIGDQLAQAGKSWKSYQEDLPPTGADNVNYADGSFSNLDKVDQSKVQKLYAVKHNPFVYFDSIQKNSDVRSGLKNIVGFSGSAGLYADLASGKVPSMAFIAPNQCHDMHGAPGGSALCTEDASTIQAGDRAVMQIIGAIKKSPAWKEGQNAIVVLWDENDYSATPNQVVTIVDTNYGVRGVPSAAPYNHFSLLKTLEVAFGLRCINHACDDNVAVMSDLFAPSHHTNDEKQQDSE